MSGAIGAVPGDRASVLLGRAFRDEGAQVAVVDLEPELPRPRDLSSLERVLAEGATTVDLSDWSATRADAVALASAVRGRDLTAVVPTDDVERPLTGLTGAAVEATRRDGADLAAGLAADAEAGAWLASLGIDDGPGAGALDGLGAVLRHEGGRLVDRLDQAIEASGVRATAAEADLLVTGCTDLDFHARGGPLVERVVALAGEVLRPVIVVAARNFVSARELRLVGIESAHALHPGQEPPTVTEPALAALAARVARTWRW